MSQTHSGPQTDPQDISEARRDDATTSRPLPFTQVAFDPVNAKHHGAIHTPIYHTSLFAFETYEAFEEAFKDLQKTPVYSRGNNPTVADLEMRLAALEGGDAAKCFASGMAAISSAIMSVVGAGDHVVCCDQAYGPTREFLEQYLTRFGVETTFVDGSAVANWEQAVRPNTKLFYLESPTSVFFELQDLRACAELAKRHGIATIIDNTWATPCYQRPLALGVDLVVHSISKYMGGHSDLIGGCVIGSTERVRRIADHEYMLFGGIMAPQTAFLVSRGLRTLPLRLERHQASALKVAEHLSRQPFVTRVNHPGLASHPQHELGKRQMSGYGGLFSFDTDAPAEKLKRWASRLKYFKIGVSWGGFESLITVQQRDDRRAVRLFVGLEDPDDLIRDIDDAWAYVSANEK